MQHGDPGESSAQVRARVVAARSLQNARGTLNAELSGKALQTACQLDSDSEQLLLRAMEKLGLSARALHRILRVARTLADLDASAYVVRAHLVEALGYRQLDRRNGQSSLVSS